MTTLSAERQRLQAASRRAAIASGAGAVIVLGALVFSGFELRDLDRRVAAKQADVDELDRKRDELQADLASLEKQWEVASQNLYASSKLASSLADGVDATAPLSVVVRPMARAESIGDEPAAGRPRFEFSLWLEVPPKRAAEIASVDYFFNHPSFTPPHQESSDRASGFRVGYRGWGALSQVIITLRLKSGGTEQLAFNMLEAVNRAPANGGERPRIPEKGPVPERMPRDLVPRYRRRVK